MIRAFKIRLKPNRKQQTLLERSAHVARWAYNWALDQKKQYYEETGKTISQENLRKKLTQLKQTEEYNWLYQYSNNISKQAIKDCDKAFQNFFQKRTQFPRFKSRRRSKWSFYNDNFKVKGTKTHLRLEKIGWVRLAEKRYLPDEWKALSYRISKEGIHWYVSITVEVTNQVDSSPSTGNSIGIDLGLHTLATLSNGKKYTNRNKQKSFKRIEKRFKRLQRKVSRKYQMNQKEGDRYWKTCNIIKLEERIAKLRARMNHIRHDSIHQMTTEIVKTKPSHIVVENLNVAGMMKNKHLSREIQNGCFYEIRRQLAYKCEWYHINLVIADRFYPSSKTCSHCGQKKQHLRLSDRIFSCSCGNVMDRDVNAAINLAKLAS